MKKTLAIIGSGDLGQQIAYYAISDGHFGDVVFFDDYETESSKKGYKVIGTLKDIESQYLKGAFNEIIIGIGYKHILYKAQLFETLSHKLPFAQIIHSSCWVDKTAIIGLGCVVYPRTTIDANVTIGNNCIINIDCSIAHDTTIGNHSFLSPRVALAGFIIVENKCILGINSTIIDNISIIGGTQLGGGTVVIKNIEKPGLYVGNPQKLIR